MPTIEIIREANKIKSVKVIMPIWHSVCDDNFIQVKVPLLGDMETFASNEDDIETAVKEAIQCFIMAAEDIGQGFEAELKQLGWKSEKNNSTLKVKTNIPAFEFMMDTGETHELWLQVA